MSYYNYKPKKNIAVSVIMATYNRSHLITGTLEAIQQQTFQDWECIIIDDGSTDNTKAVLSPYLKNGSKFKYFERSENHKKGLPGCRNQGLELAKGDYVIFFDDDDVMHPQNLELCMTVFKNYNPDFCSYQKQPFFEENKTWNFKEQKIEVGRWVGKTDMEAILKNEIPLASCTVMWRKECYEDEKFNEDLMYAEEWECYSRIISNNKMGLTIKNVLYHNRKHSQSNTGEFWKGDKVRIESKKNAIKQVLNNLNKKDLLTPRLSRYLIRLGFSLKDPSIINKTLHYSGAGPSKKIMYFLGFHFYFVIKPIFQLNKIFRKF